MRYLVTGGAGFIGSHIVEELVRRNHSVVVLDDLSTGREQNLASVDSRIDFRIGSVTEPESVQSASQGVDYVIHLAARTSVPDSVENPAATHLVNIDGTLNVLLSARDCGVKRFVFAASSAVYGEPSFLPLAESLAPDPISPYGLSKFVGELYGQLFTRTYGLESASVRFFNVFGPRQDPRSPYSGVLSRFMLAMQRGEPLIIYGDGEQSRDFIYVDDIVDITLKLCEVKEAAGLVFNGGTGQRISLNQVSEFLAQITGRAVRREHLEPRKGDIRDSQADISLSRRVLGFEPRYSFPEGLKRTWDWYRGNRLG